MRTRDLIATLAADRMPAARPERRLPAALGLAAVVALGVVVAIGIRPDLATALESWRVMLKPLAAVSLLVPALIALLGLARPAGRPRGSMAAMLLAPVLLAAAVAVELVTVPADGWPRAAMGGNALFCLVAIGTIGILPLAGLLFALRSGAPTRPALTGLVAGLASGALTAALYALHCTDDSPLFVALWYTAGVTALGLAGAAAGSRLLRW